MGLDQIWPEDQAGFTLIELMVVLLIVAILLAIAIPTFLGIAGTASNRAAQANLSNALVEAASQFQSVDENFDEVTTMVLNKDAPEFAWTNGDCVAASPDCVSSEPVDVAAPGDGEGMILAVFSRPTETCWYAVDLVANPTSLGGDTVGSAFTAASGVTTAGTYYAKQTVASGGTCTAAQADSPGWNWGPDYLQPGSNPPAS